MAKPCLSQVVCVNTHPNLTSRVWAGWPSVLPGPARGFLFPCGDTRPVHLDTQDWNRLSHHRRQIQPHGPLDLFQLARGDVCSDRLRRSLHGFGGHLQIGQQFHVLSALVERGLLTEHRLHATHSGGGLGVFDVQFDIGGELTRMAVCAQIIGAGHAHCSHRGEHRLGTQLPVAGLVAARAGDGPQIVGRGVKLQQQFAQRGCPGTMHGRAHGHLDRFHVQTAGLAAVGENDT